MLVFQMHFIEQFENDVAAAVGFPVMVEVNRGPTLEQKVWTRLTEANVAEYGYSCYTGEEYRVRATKTPEATRLNGYWGGIVANFFLQYLPGCCGICLSYHAATVPLFQRKGVGFLSRKFRENIAHAQGFSMLLSTATATNAAQNSIMKKSTAKPVYSFINNRSRNEVVISAYPLRLGAETSLAPHIARAVPQPAVPVTPPMRAAA